MKLDVDHRWIEQRLAIRAAIGNRRRDNPAAAGRRVVRQSVRPLVCTPELASKMIASPSRTSPTMRSGLWVGCGRWPSRPGRSCSGSTMPRSVGVSPPPQTASACRHPSANPSASSSDCAGLGEPLGIAHRRVHRHRNRQCAGRDQIVDDRRDGIDADVAIKTLAGAASASHRRPDSWCPGLLRHGRDIHRAFRADTRFRRGCRRVRQAHGRPVRSGARSGALAGALECVKPIVIHPALPVG